jgi:hypothetical protein
MTDNSKEVKDTISIESRFLNDNLQCTVMAVGPYSQEHLESIQLTPEFQKFKSAILTLFNMISDYGRIIVKIIDGSIQLSNLEGFILQSGTSSLILQLHHKNELKKFEGFMYPHGTYDLISAILNNEDCTKLPLMWFNSILSNNTLNDTIHGKQKSFIDDHEVDDSLVFHYEDGTQIVLDNLLDTLNGWLHNISFKVYNIAFTQTNMINEYVEYKIKIIKSEVDGTYYFSII